MADFLEHLAQFAITALDQNDFVPGIVTLSNLANTGWGGANLARTGLTLLDGNAGAKNVQLAFGWNSSHLDQIGFFHADGGLGQFIG
jgi:hypothetical protein